MAKACFFAAVCFLLPGAAAQYDSGGTPQPPLVQRGDSMAKPCRGDCEVDCIMLLGCMIGCGSTAWERRHFANPSVGVRRQLPLHKGAVFAGLHRTSVAVPCRDTHTAAA